MDIRTMVNMKLSHSKRKCVICLAEMYREMLIAEQISDVEYSELEQKLQLLTRQSPNRARLVCSMQCYELLLENVKAMQEAEKPKKCLNSRCRHTEKMHPMGGACQAARCKCYAFSEQLLQVSRVYKTAEQVQAEFDAVEQGMIPRGVMAAEIQYKTLMCAECGTNYELSTQDASKACIPSQPELFCSQTCEFIYTQKVSSDISDTKE